MGVRKGIQANFQKFCSILNRIAIGGGLLLAVTGCRPTIYGSELVTVVTTGDEPAVVAPIYPTVTFSAQSGSYVNGEGSAVVTLNLVNTVSQKITLADIQLTNPEVSCILELDDSLTAEANTESLTVTISGCTGEGETGISLAANVLKSSTGHGNLIQSSADTFLTVDNTAPIAVTSMVFAGGATSAQTAITAQWTPSASTDVATYSVQFYIGSACSTRAGNPVVVDATSANNATFVGINTKIYSFRVTSVDHAGNSIESACSYKTSNPNGRVTITQVASRLGFYVQPVQVNAGVAMSTSVVVQVEDAGGGLIPNSTASISLAMKSHVTNAALSGGSARNAVGGRATFAGLIVDKGGSGHRLEAISTGLTTGTSNAFEVLDGAQTVTKIARASSQVSPTTTAPIDFTVTFGKTIDPATLVAGDFSQEGTANVGAWTLEDSGDHRIFNLRASDIRGEGTLLPTLPANRVTDIYGQSNAAFSSSAIEVEYEEAAVTVGFLERSSFVDEGNSVSQQSLALVLSAAKSYPVSIAYSISDFYTTLSTPGQYTSSSQSVTIPAGETAAEITFSFAGNATPDAGAPGAIHVSLAGTNSRSVVLGENSVHRRIFLDDDGGYDPFVQVAAGSYSACGISALGKLRCWGSNSFGQLGVGTTTNQSSPVEVDSGTSYAKVFGGLGRHCAITISGVLKCWGWNSAGKLGDGSTTDRSLPTVIDTGYEYSDISMGNYNTCGITTDGVLKCWGANGNYQLQDGTVIDRYTPIVIQSGTAFKKVAVGVGYVCAINASDELICWGSNSYGQLGDGAYVQRNSPIQIDSGNHYAEIEAGETHTCGITTSGVLKCWGNGGNMRLGNNSTANISLAATIDAGTTYKSVKTFATHTCGLTTGNILKCWGENSYGKVGDGTANTRNTPAVVDSGVEYSMVTVGQSFTCGLTMDSILKCWGSNGDGQFGNGTIGMVITPLHIDKNQTYQFVGAGWGSSCALTIGGEMKCWGRNNFGILGDGGSADKFVPAPTNIGRKFASVTLSRGGGHVCALTTAGKLFCWGQNESGQVGTGSIDSVGVTEVTAINANMTYSKVTAGTWHTCGITGGALKCWGYNGDSQLGDGSATNQTSPTVIDSGVSYAEISAGKNHTCGIAVGGELRCWGKNSVGQLGDGTTSNRSSPVVIDSGVAYAKVSAGLAHTCGITVDEVLKCWGNNDNGKLGNNSYFQSSTPIVIDSGVSYASVVAGEESTCGITTAGVLKCWGSSTYYLLGNGDYTIRPVPTIIDSGTSYTHISLGAAHACGVTAASALKCWGFGFLGRVGNGAFDIRWPSLVW